MAADERQSTTIRFDLDDYEWLRLQSYQHRVPIQQIVAEAVTRLRNTPDWKPQESS